MRPANAADRYAEPIQSRISASHHCQSPPNDRLRTRFTSQVSTYASQAAAFQNSTSGRKMQNAISSPVSNGKRTFLSSASMARAV